MKKAIKQYLDKFNDIYNKYLILPIILMCAAALVYYTLFYNITEIITWGIVLGINLLNLYFIYSKEDL